MCPPAYNCGMSKRFSDRLAFATNARAVAIGLAVAGFPLGIVLADRSFRELPPADALLVLLPLGLAYLPVLWSAIGKRLWGDPFTTWIPWIAVDVLWLAYNHPYGFPVERERFMHEYQAIFIVAAAAGGVFAIVFQVLSKLSRN